MVQIVASTNVCPYYFQILISCDYNGDSFNDMFPRFPNCFFAIFDSAIVFQHVYSSVSMFSLSVSSVSPQCSPVLDFVKKH